MGRPAAHTPSYLLRIVSRREVRCTVHYELRDLASGELHRFRSLRALRRFLAEQNIPGRARFDGV